MGDHVGIPGVVLLLLLLYADPSLVYYYYVLLLLQPKVLLFSLSRPQTARPLFKLLL